MLWCRPQELLVALAVGFCGSLSKGCGNALLNAPKRTVSHVEGCTTPLPRCELNPLTAGSQTLKGPKLAFVMQVRDELHNRMLSARAGY